MKRLLVLLMVAFTLVSTSTLAGDLYPDIPKATGKPHPEGNEYMRINHMDMLKHDRDTVVRQGVRDEDNSLAQCISCHVVKDEDNKPVTIKSEEHFCRVCHDFAAVKLDCFSCHNSVPTTPLQSSALYPHSNTELDGLLAYLEGVAK